MLSTRQWQYIYSRLQIEPSKLFNRLNIACIENLPYRIEPLNRLCKRSLSLSLADLCVEAENVYNIYELAQITGLDRTLIHYRINSRHIKKITSHPTVHILMQDLWTILKLPKISTLLKSNPLFQYRYSSRTSINQLATALSISTIDLVKLEYGSLYPSYQLCTALQQLDPKLPLHLRLWYDLYHRSTL